MSRDDATFLIAGILIGAFTQLGNILLLLERMMLR